MKLQTCKLCVNCESLYEEHAACPYCRSEVFVWLTRALGTTLEENADPIDDYPMAEKETAGFPIISGNTVFGSKSFTEFRINMGRWGKEMVRVLTLGMMQAFK